MYLPEMQTLGIMLTWMPSVALLKLYGEYRQLWGEDVHVGQAKERLHGTLSCRQ